MKRPKTLTAAFVRTVKAAGRYGDGRGSHGLSLLVKPTANGRISKSWTQRAKINGRFTSIGLGPFPLVTLAEAREAALQNARELRAGRDPRGGGIPAFGAASETVLAIHRGSWRAGSKTEAQWRTLIRDYCGPIADTRVDRITTADLLAVLLPVWTAKPETGRKLRQRIGLICRWAVAAGHRPDDPSGPALSAALPRQGNGATHFRALPYGDLPAALRTIRDSGAHPTTKLAIDFLALTVGRSGEIRGARWDEIDWDGKVWTVPAERMKARRPHRVPLSDTAMAVLIEAEDYRESDLIFPSATGRQLSDNTLSKLFRDLGIPGTPHGLRSGFRDWAAEKTDTPREIAEAALAHAVKSKVEAAYARTDHLEKRRELMASWANYLSQI